MRKFSFDWCLKKNSLYTFISIFLSLAMKGKRDGFASFLIFWTEIFSCFFVFFFLKNKRELYQFNFTFYRRKKKQADRLLNLSRDNKKIIDWLKTWKNWRVFSVDEARKSELEKSTFMQTISSWNSSEYPGRLDLDEPGIHSRSR